MFTLQNKTAVITGASRGIGRSIALQMAELGANIAILYAGNEAAAAEVKTQALKTNVNVQAESYRCNVADFIAAETTVAEILRQFGKVDILVNNAGVAKDKLLMRMTPQDFSDVIDVNLQGAFNMLQPLCRHFAQNRSGRIINITSVVGLAGNAGQSNYSSAKAGLIGLTKSVARELAGRGVTCNAIAPGYIDTDMTRKLPKQTQEDIVKTVPLKSAGAPEDVAYLTAFLASDLSSYITGEVIRVDGGMCM